MARHNTQFQEFYNQRYSTVCLVMEFTSGDYVAFWGGTMVSIFLITESGMVLFDEYNDDNLTTCPQAERSAILHIEENQ